MKRARILAILLCAFTLIVPLSGISASDSECPSYPHCADSRQCNLGDICVKKPGQACGICG
jgi:hypothetical protein